MLLSIFVDKIAIVKEMMDLEIFGLDITLWIVVIIIFVLCPYLIFKIAKKKNRNAVIWTIVSFITNPIIILIIISLVSTVTKEKKSKNI